MTASTAYIGLASPGDLGSWQRENKVNIFKSSTIQLVYKISQNLKWFLLVGCIQGYQFWSQCDALGYFKINNIRAGNYSLYAWVPGIIGDYKYNVPINIETG